MKNCLILLTEKQMAVTVWRYFYFGGTFQFGGTFVNYGMSLRISHEKVHAENRKKRPVITINWLQMDLNVL